MSRRPAQRAFAALPSDADTWVHTRQALSSHESEASLFTARLTIDVTPEQRGRIKVTAFQRGQTVADMLRELLAARIPRPGWRPAMNASAAARRPSNDAATALTHVELTWLEKRIEHWIRFGRIAEEKVLDRRRRIVSFAPGGVFAFVRWASNDFGTIISRIDIVRAVAPGDL